MGSTRITKTEYIKILEFYKEPIPASYASMKSAAESILATKLCRCIKKVAKSDGDEEKAIGICTRAVFNNKGLSRGRFTCKKRRTVTITKLSKSKKSSKTRKS